MYNVTLHMGGFSLEVLKEGWLGFPIAYVFAMCCDWFLVSGLAKKFAYLSGKTGRQCTEKSHLCILFHGRTDGDHHVHVWCCRRMCPLRRMVSAANDLDDQHPKGTLSSLPFQLLVAGPLVRFVFRTAFPEGKVLA